MIHINGMEISPKSLEAKARSFAALSSPARLAIVIALGEKERNVGELVEILAGLDCPCSVERTNVSKHLSVLREAGVVACAGEAQRRIYRLAAPCLLDSIACLSGAPTAGNCCESRGGSE